MENKDNIIMITNFKKCHQSIYLKDGYKGGEMVVAESKKTKSQ